VITTCDSRIPMACKLPYFKYWIRTSKASSFGTSSLTNAVLQASTYQAEEEAT